MWMSETWASRAQVNNALAQFHKANVHVTSCADYHHGNILKPTVLVAMET